MTDPIEFHQLSSDSKKKRKPAMNRIIPILTGALVASPITSSATVLIAGWDTFGGSSNWTASQLVATAAATAVSSTEHNNWGDWNNSNQGASGDGTFGNLSPTVATASTAFTGGSGSGQNLSLNRSNGTIVFTLTNNSGSDGTIEGFYFDSIWRTGPAANTWELTVGGAISGTTGGSAPVNQASNMNSATSAQRDKAVDLTGLTDNVWEAGSDAIFTLSFTGAGNSGSGGGNELVVDNIGITGTIVPEPSAAVLFGLGGLAFVLRRRK